MSVKRGSAEDVYALALQRLNARAKAELPEPQSPGAEPHARRDHICDRRPRELRVILSLVVRPSHGPMPNEGIEGDEWGAYGVLGRSSVMEHGMAYRTRVPRSRSSHSTQPNLCNGETQTDCNVCRCLADHRPGDPVCGRGGEGEQVIRDPGPVRYARCEEPQLTWSSFEVSSDIITGKRLEIERLTSRLEEGRWKSTLMGNSLAAYPTSCTVLQRQGAG